MKDEPLRKADLELLQDFQKRKAEKQLEGLKDRYSRMEMLKSFHSRGSSIFLTKLFRDD